jgi:hypothetical protein
VIASGLAKHQHGFDDWREDRELALRLVGDPTRFDQMVAEVRAIIERAGS